MNWFDYRKQLGIGVEDREKGRILANKVATFIEYDDVNSDYSSDDYYRFCLLTGYEYDPDNFETESVADLFRIGNPTVPEVIADYLAFVNTQMDRERKRELIRMFSLFLDDLNIAFEIKEDKDGYFIFPNGAKELDDALVSEPLQWLADYPEARKTYVIALKQYQNRAYIRDTADNLRKALEAFLQEFLNNEKNLETNKNEICRYLGEQGVDAGISGLFQPLINAYKNINDRIAKHNDKVDEKLLEFLLYQTGVLIRMILVVHRAETEAKTHVV